jgi:hypothetical protein
MVCGAGWGWVKGVLRAPSAKVRAVYGLTIGALICWFKVNRCAQPDMHHPEGHSWVNKSGPPDNGCPLGGLIRYRSVCISLF